MWMSASPNSSFSKTLVLQMCFCVFGAGLFLPRVHPPAHVSEQGPCSPYLGAALRGGARQARRAHSPPGEGVGGRALGVGGFAVSNSYPCSAGSLCFGLSAPAAPAAARRTVIQRAASLRRTAAWAGARRRLCALPLCPPPGVPPSSSSSSSSGDCRVGNQAPSPPERRPCLLTYKLTI